MMHPSALMAFQLESAIVRNPLTVSLDTTVLDAVTKMNAANQLENVDFESQFSTGALVPKSCVLIVDKHRVVGILTDRDVMRLIAQPLALADLVISDVMSHPVITLNDDSFTDLPMAIDILCQNHIRHLPLIDRHNCLIGLLTRESLQQRCHPTQLWQEHISTLQQELTERCITQELLEQRNHQLVMSNEELARATKLKDEFLTNMSHELRTPLNAILGMTEGLQEGIFGVPNPAQIQAVKTIENSSNHLLALINDILDLAKIGAGQVELECNPTNIYDLCHSSLSFVKQQAVQKRIRLQIQLPPRIPNISIDERRIRQVLINLLNNAVKFTPMGGNIALNVTIEADNTASEFIRLAVIDTGIGINSADLLNLFQPFTQVDIALNRQYNGTGLGLSLVKGIVEMHGGSVQVRSEVGVGSQFIVDLPIPQGECDANGKVLIQSLEFSQPVSQQLDPLTGEISHRVSTILLVEDNEANINSISSYLTAKGYRTLLARNGLEAINLAQSQLPDLILMDIQMPKMDGLEAIRHIRKHPQLIGVPIVAVTALAMNGDREKCLSAGANDYLSKPIKLKQLATIIQQFLSTDRINCELS
jgi:signal transduction histidine kinase/ActR/RegA family two-component response regulator